VENEFFNRIGPKVGVIGMQRIALMQEHKVNMFEALPLALGAVIMVIGIGGNIGYEGAFLPQGSGLVPQRPPRHRHRRRDGHRDEPRLHRLEKPSAPAQVQPKAAIP
jgi:hypothetical protein